MRGLGRAIFTPGSGIAPPLSSVCGGPIFGSPRRKRSEVGERLVHRRPEWCRRSRRLRQEESSLDRGQSGERQGVGVNGGFDLPGGLHGPDAVGEKTLPLHERRGDDGPCLEIGVAQLGDERSDPASADHRLAGGHSPLVARPMPPRADQLVRFDKNGC